MSHPETRRRLLAALGAAALLVLSCSTVPPEQKEANLSKLVESGDTGAVKEFLQNQEQLNLKDSRGLYPLHYAVIRNDLQTASYLIDKGAMPNNADQAGKTPLRYAIDRKQVPMAKLLVERDADPFAPDVSGLTPAEACLSAGPEMIAAVFNVKNINKSGQDGRTVLHLAADKLMVAEVSQLLEMNASVQTKDKAERTALDLALLHPDDRKAAQIAEKLILKGGNPSYAEFMWFRDTVRSADYNNVRFARGNTPIHESVDRNQLGFLDFLLSKGLAPDIKNSDLNTALHLAVQKGLIDYATILLKNGAKPEITDGQGNTALHLSVPQSVRLEMTKLLLSFKADPSLQDKEGNTPLHKAVKLTYEPMVASELIRAKAPVNAQNLEGDTPLMICVKAGNYQYADELIAAGASIFLKNPAGESPLSIAVKRGVEAVDRIVLPANVRQFDDMKNSVISTAVAMKASPEVISLILSKGADPNLPNNAQDNALHIAVRMNLAQQGSLLLGAKTDIFAMNSAGETPVFLALAAKDGPYDWFFTPAVITARNTNGDTVGHLAARKDLADGLDYLKSKGMELDAVNSAKETLLHSAIQTDAAEAVRYLIANGASIIARDINGEAPLNVAVLSGSKTCLQILSLIPGIDLNTRNFSGEAPLHEAVRKQNRDFVVYLAERGADLSARDGRGSTPLAVAAREAQTSIAQYLIKSGAAVDHRDYSGSTPLYYSVEAGQLDLVKLLVQSGASILARNAAGDSPLMVSLKKGQSILREMLSMNGVEKTDSEGKTALRLLVDAGASAEMLKLALAAGADPSSRDRMADTPLHAAMARKDF
ncbi:MAG TPA: ankyrin repeat domain-containing protein, partial [Rectinemataceae bacterium]